MAQNIKKYKNIRVNMQQNNNRQTVEIRGALDSKIEDIMSNSTHNTKSTKSSVNKRNRSSSNSSKFFGSTRGIEDNNIGNIE